MNFCDGEFSACRAALCLDCPTSGTYVSCASISVPRAKAKPFVLTSCDCRRSVAQGRKQGTVKSWRHPHRVLRQRYSRLLPQKMQSKWI